jgi:hypothetical protein
MAYDRFFPSVGSEKGEPLRDTHGQDRALILPMVLLSPAYPALKQEGQSKNTEGHSPMYGTVKCPVPERCKDFTNNSQEQPRQAAASTLGKRV